MCLCSREMFNKCEAQRWWGENYDRVVELYNVQTFRQQGLSTPSSSADDAMQVSSPANRSSLISSDWHLISLHQDIQIVQSFYSRGSSTRESPAPIPPPAAASSRERPPISRTASCKASRAACYPSSAAVPDPSDHVWAHHLSLLNSAAGASGAAAGPYDPSPRATTSSRGDEASSVVSVSNASELEGAEQWVEQDEPGVHITIRELADGTRELRRVRFSRERFGEERAKVWWEQNRDRIHAQYL